MVKECWSHELTRAEVQAVQEYSESDKPRSAGVKNLVELMYRQYRSTQRLINCGGLET